MDITKDAIKSAIDQLDDRDLPAIYSMICELRNLARKDSGQRMAAVLRRMSNRNALVHLTDPVAWQRETREDRPLPDRE